MDGSDFSLKTKAKAALLRPEITMLLVLIVFCIVLSVVTPNFATSKNLLNILRQISIYAILAVGEAFVILTGGIDLSVGCAIGWAACVGGVCSQAHMGPAVILIVMLIAGVIPGFLNGLLVTYVGLPPFIATLGMLSILNGSALMITGGFPIIYSGTWICSFGGGYVGIVPISVIVMLLIVVIGYIVAKDTVYGRNVYAIGNNERSALFSGINVTRVKIIVYTLAGLLAAVCGIIELGLLSGADASYGKGAELDVIAAAVIGGISMTGGEGNILGVLIGAAIMGVLDNAFVLLGISGYAQIVTLGVVIIVAVAADSLTKKKK